MPYGKVGRGVDTGTDKGFQQWWDENNERLRRYKRRAFAELAWNHAYRLAYNAGVRAEAERHERLAATPEPKVDDR